MAYSASSNILFSRLLAYSVHHLRTCQFSQRVLVHKSSLLSTSNPSLNTSESSGIAFRSLNLFTKHKKKLQKECTFLLRHYSDVPLTIVKHPDMKRGSFAVLSNEDIAFFKKLLYGRVITDESELLPYNTDWLKTVRGASKVVLRPKTTQEVSDIVKYCYDHNLAVCPQGGNTGLVGGSVPVFDEVVITTQLMNQIISLDQVSGILVCQSGCILEALDHYLSNFELTMPLDLGAKGSCQIGGNVSTNAGGIRLLRYGSLHGNVLGLEVVLPNGEIVDCLTTLRKDNTGYDLKQLFIGAEGTLGIITAVSILCPPQPKSVSVALLGCETFDSILQVFKSSKLYLGEILSAFEFMDSQSMILVKENLKLNSPLVDYPFYALVECSGSNAHHDEEKLMSLLHAVLDKGEALDGCIVTDSAKIKNIWSLRERCAEALMYDGYCYKYDVSLPLSAFYQLVLDMRDRLGANATRVVAYGHVGDGNLHLNITSRQYSQTTFDLIEPFVFEWVAKYRGSISAEHGLGLKKREYIHHSKTPPAVTLMAAVKKTIDPKGIMNPYKVLPESILR